MTQENVLEALKNVTYPGFTKDIVTFGFVKDVVVDGSNVSLTIDITSSADEVKSRDVISKGVGRYASQPDNETDYQSNRKGRHTDHKRNLEAGDDEQEGRSVIGGRNDGIDQGNTHQKQNDHPPGQRL